MNDEGFEARMLTLGISLWHRNGRFYARQGVLQASVTFEGDCVRSAIVRSDARRRAMAALIRAKTAVQQMQRPPAADSRPRPCHAALEGGRMVCRQCRIRWSAYQEKFPDCRGDL